MSYHEMYTPQAVFVLFLLAFMIDYWSVGTDSIRDRVAFLLALPAIRVGFDGSELDRWTTQQVLGLIEWGKAAGGDAYVATATAASILAILINFLGLFVIAVLLPSKFSKRLGKIATLKFVRRGSRINYMLWACAFFLGLMVEMATGDMGKVINSLVDQLVTAVAVVPVWFGA